MGHSTDYHDYVFKDGCLVGKFEDMYKYSSEVPWYQDKEAYAASSDIDIAILKQFKYDSICEIGCGLGYFTDRLYNELSYSRGTPKVTGIDVSQTAVKKAKVLFPQIRFIKSNLLIERPMSDGCFDLVVIKDVLWYVCHDLDQFYKNVIDMIMSKCMIYISQSFPVLEKPFVGKDVFPNPQALLTIFEKDFNGLTLNIFHRLNFKEEGPCFHWLGVKKT
mgnify:CR=1 FL=1|jgi:SAM-dependent methyltransferase